MAWVSITTLKDVKEHGYTLTAHCAAPNLTCGHHQELDIDFLIDRFGTHHRIVNDKRIGAACRCKHCGHKGATIRLSPPSPDTRPNQNQYLKAKGL